MITIPKPNYEVGFKTVRNAHMYTVGSATYPSVTKITGIIDKSGALMVWARRQSLALAKKELLEAIKSGVALTEETLDALLLKADKQPDKVKDDAADLGSRVHAAIDAHILGQTSILDEQSRPGYENFTKWLESSGVKMIMGDTAVASIKYGYGGKLDAIGEKNGQIVLLDWKTSNSFKGRESYSLQASAYAVAFTETYGIDVDYAYVVRFGKEIPGDIEVKEVDLCYGFTAFKSALELTKGMKSKLWKGE